MDHKVFFKYAPEDMLGEEAMYSRHRHSIKKDGTGTFTFKEERKTFSETGNEEVGTEFAPLDGCRCIVDSSHEKIVEGIDGKLYCEECTPYCPSCGYRILPGEGERIEGVWFHKDGCGTFEKMLFSLKCRFKISFLAAKEKQEHLKPRLMQAQIDDIHANRDFRREQLRLEGARLQMEFEDKAVQRSLMSRQLNLQERQAEHRIRIESGQLCLQAREQEHRERIESRRLDLQQTQLDRTYQIESTRLQFQAREQEDRERIESGRLWLQGLQLEHTIDMGNRDYDLKKKAVQSRVDSQDLANTINKGRLKLELIDRLAKFEKEGLLPEGTTKKALP